jgi:hypothetical protein
MWEAIKNFAEVGRGNIIFNDGSSEGMQRFMQQIIGMLKCPWGLRRMGNKAQGTRHRAQEATDNWQQAIGKHCMLPFQICKL